MNNPMDRAGAIAGALGGALGGTISRSLSAPFGLASSGSFWRAPSRVRLRTLILLRWMAIAGQTAALLVVQFGLGFKVPLGAALAVVSASAWVNLLLMLALPSQRLVREWEAALQLAYDRTAACAARRRLPAASKTHSCCCSSRRSRYPRWHCAP